MTEVIQQHDRLKVAMRPARREVVSAWLANLGVLLAGRMSLEEAKIKISAYSDLMTVPEFRYTQDTLRAAALEFTWWPSFKELNDFLNQQDSEIDRAFWRLATLRRLPTDEALAAAKAADEAEKLRKLLETPGGRIAHRWYNQIGCHCTGLGWWGWKDEAIKTHGEAQVDAWHAEVAALDWSLPGFDPIIQLRLRSQQAIGTAEVQS